MAKLSKAAWNTIAALGSDNRLCVSTLRNGTGAEWRTEVSIRGQMSRFTVSVPVFRKLVKDGFLAYDCSHAVTTDLIHSEYVLTDAARALLRAEPHPPGRA